MDGIQELIKLTEQNNKAFENFKSRIDDRLDGLEAKAGRPNLGGNPLKPRGKQLPQFYDTKAQRVINVLSCDESMAALEHKSMSSSGQLPSIGRVLRGIVLGSRAHDAAELEEERKSLSIGSGTGGGFTVAGRAVIGLDRPAQGKNGP
jgi:hypothetical protein